MNKQYQLLFFKHICFITHFLYFQYLIFITPYTPRYIFDLYLYLFFLIRFLVDFREINISFTFTSSYKYLQQQVTFIFVIYILSPFYFLKLYSGKKNKCQNRFLREKKNIYCFKNTNITSRNYLVHVTVNK